MENEEDNDPDKTKTDDNKDQTGTLQSAKSWVTTATEGEMAPESWYYTWRAMRERFYPHYIFYPQDPRFWEDDKVYLDDTLPMGYGVSYNSLTRVPMNRRKIEVESQSSDSRRPSVYRKSCTVFLIVIGMLLLLTATIPVLLHILLGKEPHNLNTEGVVHTRLEVENLEYMSEMANTSHPKFKYMGRSLQKEIDELFSKSEVRRFYKGSTATHARNASSNTQVFVDLHFNPIDHKIPLYRQLTKIFRTVPRDANDSSIGVLGNYRIKLDSVDMYDTELLFLQTKSSSKDEKSLFSLSTKILTIPESTTRTFLNTAQNTVLVKDINGIRPDLKDDQIHNPILQNKKDNNGDILQLLSAIISNTLNITTVNTLARTNDELLSTTHKSFGTNIRHESTEPAESKELLQTTNSFSELSLSTNSQVDELDTVNGLPNKKVTWNEYGRYSESITTEKPTQSPSHSNTYSTLTTLDSSSNDMSRFSDELEQQTEFTSLLSDNSTWNELFYRSVNPVFTTTQIDMQPEVEVYEQKSEGFFRERDPLLSLNGLEVSTSQSFITEGIDELFTEHFANDATVYKPGEVNENVIKEAYTETDSSVTSTEQTNMTMAPNFPNKFILGTEQKYETNNMSLSNTNVSIKNQYPTTSSTLVQSFAKTLRPNSAISNSPNEELTHYKDITSSSALPSLFSNYDSHPVESTKNVSAIMDSIKESTTASYSVIDNYTEFSRILLTKPRGGLYKFFSSPNSTNTLSTNHFVSTENKEAELKRQTTSLGAASDDFQTSGIQLATDASNTKPNDFLKNTFTKTTTQSEITTKQPGDEMYGMERVSETTTSTPVTSTVHPDTESKTSVPSLNASLDSPRNEDLQKYSNAPNMEYNVPVQTNAAMNGEYSGSKAVMQDDISYETVSVSTSSSKPDTKTVVSTLQDEISVFTRIQPNQDKTALVNELSVAPVTNNAKAVTTDSITVPYISSKYVSDVSSYDFIDTVITPAMTTKDESMQFNTVVSSIVTQPSNNLTFEANNGFSLNSNNTFTDGIVHNMSKNDDEWSVNTTTFPSTHDKSTSNTSDSKNRYHSTTSTAFIDLFSPSAKRFDIFRLVTRLAKVNKKQTVLSFPYFLDIDTTSKQHLQSTTEQTLFNKEFGMSTSNTSHFTSSEDTSPPGSIRPFTQRDIFAPQSIHTKHSKDIDTMPLHETSLFSWNSMSDLTQSPVGFKDLQNRATLPTLQFYTGESTTPSAIEGVNSRKVFIINESNTTTSNNRMSNTDRTDTPRKETITLTKKNELVNATKSGWHSNTTTVATASKNTFTKVAANESIAAASEISFNTNIYIPSERFAKTVHDENNLLDESANQPEERSTKQLQTKTRVVTSVFTTQIPQTENIITSNLSSESTETQNTPNSEKKDTLYKTTDTATGLSRIIQSEQVPWINILWNVNVKPPRDPSIKRGVSGNAWRRADFISPMTFDIFSKERNASAVNGNGMFTVAATSEQVQFKPTTDNFSDLKLEINSNQVEGKTLTPSDVTYSVPTKETTEHFTRSSTTTEYMPHIKYLWSVGLDLLSGLYNEGNKIEQPDSKLEDGRLVDSVSSAAPPLVKPNDGFRVIDGESLEPKETLVISNNNSPVSFSNMPKSERGFNQNHVEGNKSFWHSNSKDLWVLKAISSTVLPTLDHTTVAHVTDTKFNFSRNEITQTNNVPTNFKEHQVMQKSSKSENLDKSIFDISNKLDSSPSRLFADTIFPGTFNVIRHKTKPNIAKIKYPEPALQPTGHMFETSTSGYESTQHMDIHVTTVSPTEVNTMPLLNRYQGITTMTEEGDTHTSPVASGIVLVGNVTAIIGDPVSMSWSISGIRGWSHIVLERLMKSGTLERIAVISSASKTPTYEHRRLKLSANSQFDADNATIVLEIPVVLCADEGTYSVRVFENETITIEQQQTLTSLGRQVIFGVQNIVIPEAEVVVPDDLFEGQEVRGVKCIAVLGNPLGKLFLGVRYQDSDTFIKTMILDPSRHIVYPLSRACRPVAVVKFDDILDIRRDLNNTEVQCGVIGTPALQSNTKMTMSEIKKVKMIPADICARASSTLIPHPFITCSQYIDCSSMTVTSCPEDTCFNHVLGICVQNTLNDLLV